MQYSYSINKSCMTEVQNSCTYQCHTGFCNRLPADQEGKLPHRNWTESSEEGLCLLGGKLPKNGNLTQEKPSHSKALISFSQM